MLGLAGQHEAVIACEALMVAAVVMIHPGDEPVAQPLDETRRRLLEALPSSFGHEGDVQDDDPRPQPLRLGQAARRGERQRDAIDDRQGQCHRG